jgi:hypothetical protein
MVNGARITTRARRVLRKIRARLGVVGIKGLPKCDRTKTLIG